MCFISNFYLQFPYTYLQKRFELLSTNEKEEEEEEEEKEEVVACETTELSVSKAKETSVVKSQITANAVLLRKCLLNVINQGMS